MFLGLETSLATVTDSYRKGDVADWPDDLDANRLIAAGYAVPASATEVGRAKKTTAVKKAIRTTAMKALEDLTLEDEDLTKGGRVE